MAARAPLAGPDVWTGAEMASRDDWLHPLDDGERSELVAAVRAARASHRSMWEVDRARFPLGRLGERLARVARQLEHGCGFATLRGVRDPALDEEALRWALWGIGAHLGTAVSQSPRGVFMEEVRDVGEVMGQPTSRGYRSGGALRFHTDRCDIVALLCVRQCREGGDSLVVSTPAIHNAMLARAPALLEELFGVYCHSRQGEQIEGEHPWYPNPVFAVHQGRFTSQYSRSYVESAQRFADVPRLRAEQSAALDLLADLAHEFAFRTRLEPGDLQLLNNHVTYHARTAITADHDDPARKRCLYRLWLASPISRALPPDYAVLWGATAAGAIRGGVTPASRLRDVAAWRRAQIASA